MPANGSVYGEHSLWHRNGYADFLPGTDHPWDKPVDMSLYGIEGADSWVPRGRPFMEPLAVKATGQRWPVIVRMSFDDGGLWFGVEAEALPDIGGILLTEPNPMHICPDGGDPEADNMIYAIIEGRCRVRATCMIVGDERVRASSFQPGTMQSTSAQVFGDRDSYVKEVRSGSSGLSGAPDRERYPWLPGHVVLAVICFNQSETVRRVG